MVYIDSEGKFFAEIYQDFGRRYEYMAHIYSRYKYREHGQSIFSSNQPTNVSAEYSIGNPHQDKFKITFINGILNDKVGAGASAKLVSDIAGGREVIYIHNASFGELDLVECCLNLCGIQTPPSIQLANTWTRILQDPEMRILHPAHSQGMLHTKLALRQMDSEMKKRITVIGIAPAGILNEDECGSAIHYVSETDFVPWFDQYWSSNENFAPIITLTPKPGAGCVDHCFASPTYTEPLETEINKFITANGCSR